MSGGPDRRRADLGCLEFPLDAATLARLDAASAREPGFLHAFTDDGRVRDPFHGETYAATAVHRRRGASW